MKIYFKGCAKCAGDLLPDEDAYRCFQCGLRIYPPANDDEGNSPMEPASTAKRRRARMSGTNVLDWATRQEKLDERWWRNHAEVVRRLDAGESCVQIAAVMQRTARYIRTLREELADRRDMQACGSRLIATSTHTNDRGLCQRRKKT